MDDISPAEAKGNKSRYSMYSEYDTAGEENDSDSSIYYSFINDSCVDDKENSVDQKAGGDSELVHRSAKKTPLLRKILQKQQNQATPRNQCNKRVSFSVSPKTNSMAPIAKKSATFPVVPESITEEHCNEEQSTENVFQHSDERSELIVVNDDDISNHSILHNTIIENLPEADQTIVSESNNEQMANVLEQSLDVGVANSFAVSNHVEPSSEIVVTTTIGHNLITAESHVETVEPLVMSAAIGDGASSTVSENATTTNTNDLVGAESVNLAVVSGGNPTETKNEVKPVASIEKPKTTANGKNVTSVKSRIRMTIDPKKVALPAVVKKTTRATTYKRRSIIIDPPKINARKSLAVLSKVKQFNKTNDTGKFLLFYFESVLRFVYNWIL